MANKLATVETTAIFIRSISGGKITHRRAPFNIEVRDYGAGDTRGRKSYLALAYGPVPGTSDHMRSQGEAYNSVVFWDTYPDNYPKVGLVAG